MQGSMFRRSCAALARRPRHHGHRPRLYRTSAPALQPAPLVELREYDLHPDRSGLYMEETERASGLIRARAPLRIYSLPETGGQLHTATSFYYYAGGFDERNATRHAMAELPDFQSFLAESRPYVRSQRSTLFVEAPLVGTTDGVSGLADAPSLSPSSTADSNPASILEIRRYRLKLGYDTVPRFLELYGNGLPSKLGAEGTDPTTSLVTLMYSEVGRLNEVIEVWRHGDGTQAMERSRVAARGAQEWRSAIAGIADLAVEFTSTIHKCARFSPIR